MRGSGYCRYACLRRLVIENNSSDDDGQWMTATFYNHNGRRILAFLPLVVRSLTATGTSVGVLEWT